MGAQCTRSYQTEPYNFQAKRTIVKEPMKVEKSIIIRLLVNNRKIEGISERNQKLVFYTKTFNSYISTSKFSPQTGFQNGPSKSKLMDNEVQFSLQTNETNASWLNIKGVNDLQLWRKVSSLGQPLKEGDEMVIGNKIMKLKYVLNQKEISYEKEKSTFKLGICKDKEAQCRFCLDKVLDQNNPLVMPCKCIGSVSAVHQKCLSNWVFSSSGSFKQTMSVFNFKIRHTECQICKFGFENYIWNRMMVVFSAFEGKYSIFQVKNDQVKTKQENLKQFVIFKFHQNANQMFIGKSNKCNYSINDHSLSDTNSVLILEGDNLFLKDCNSKFGTFVKQETRKLFPGYSYKLGNFYFSIKYSQNPQSRKVQTIRF